VGNPLYDNLSDRLYGTAGVWALVRCANPDCGLAWLSPAPVEADLGKVYEDYFTHESSEPAWRSNNPLYRAWVRAGALYRAAISNTPMGRARHQADTFFLAGVRPGRVLDVGCGDGSLLVRLRDMGWQVEGQETDANAAAVAQRNHGLTVHVGMLDQLHLPPHSFDAVTLSHVIEHVYDPIALLAECRRLLKPGGHLVALTPNIDSFGHAHFGRHWVALDPPRHLYLFSRTTLAQVAQRAGFTQVTVSTNAVRAQYISIASEDIRKTGHHSLHAPYRLPQLVRAMRFEQQAWRAFAHDASGGDELALEATA
jgi:2-polyprenyl-3-methyl-5-hydroxy-6-metoxy-1,4-benzoquinol methylase